MPSRQPSFSWARMAGVSCALGMVGRRQIAEDELRRRQIELQHLRIPEDRGLVGDGAVEGAAAAVVAHPCQREVVVRPLQVAITRSLLEVGLLRVDAEQHAQAVARVWLMHAEELAAVIESLAAERRVQRMRRIVELDEDMLVVGPMVRAACADHQSELRPVLHRAGPLHEGDGGTVHAHQAAAAIDKIGQVLPQLRIGEAIADRVVEEHRVELPQALALEHFRIAG